MASGPAKPPKQFWAVMVTAADNPGVMWLTTIHRPDVGSTEVFATPHLGEVAGLVNWAAQWEWQLKPGARLAVYRCTVDESSCIPIKGFD